MSSLSPGDVKILGDPEDGPGAAPAAASATARAGTSPVRVPAQKRARASSTTPVRTRALAVIGNITDTVRAGAVRGLRAITDSIERPRDESASTGTSDSSPPSPTDAIRAATFTPEGKKRRTTLTDARTRRSHADWRGAQWDYTSAMRDQNLFRVGDTGPSVFAFPDGRPSVGDGLDRAQLALEDDPNNTPPHRPSSAMSAASAPAVMSTPRSQPQRAPREDPPEEGLDDRGWVLAVARPDIDPFAIPTDGPDDQMDADTLPGEADADGERGDRFVRAVREATALLSQDTVNSPDACGALLAFQAQLRAHDPYGNFAPSPPAGDSAAAEMRELRRMVEGLAETQRACIESLGALSARGPAQPARDPAPVRLRSGGAGVAPAVERQDGPRAVSAPHDGATGKPGGKPPPVMMGATPTPNGPPLGGKRSPDLVVKGVGRHDPRRAVFRPAKPFGGRIPANASADEVRDLNATSYVVRDAVNAALRDLLVAQMDEASDPVQIAGVNWTERGNLCMVVAEGFEAPHLLLHADVAAEAAALGAGWKASRDVPIHKAVLRNVPTHRVDGTLFTEDDVLCDLRAHSVAFRSLQLADSAEQACWIATASERTRKKRSTLVLNFASVGDAKQYKGMQHCLYAFGCACEPGDFQPRERDRICRRCWNPLARHQERDFQCKARCRLCGGGHEEEDHACQMCDVLSRSCVHIPVKCANCGRAHTADDGACEYRRRLRGSSASAPPMSSGGAGDRSKSKPAPATAPGGKKGKKRVRVLEPHEPFPDDTPPPPTPAPSLPTPAPALPAATAAGSDLDAAPPASKRARASRRRKRAEPDSGDEVPDAAAATTSPPQPAQTEAQPVRVTPTQEPVEQVSAPRSPLMTAADDLAVQELLGGGEEAAMEPESVPQEPVTQKPDQGRRVAPPRGAAADFDRDGRRRRVAHVLANAFGFLHVPEAIAALRRSSDDYASAVSWADDEQNRRRKPGMQGKTTESLQKLVVAMTAAAASYKSKTTTDPATPPADE